MGTPKALLDYRGATFIGRLVSVFSGCCNPVIAVLGHHAGEVRASLASSSSAKLVINPEPGRGMLSSLQAGLAAVPAGCRAVFFHPCDMPEIQPATLSALLDALSAAPMEALAAVPTLSRKRGHPVLIRAGWIPAFLGLSGDSSARELIDSSPRSIIEVPVSDPGIRRDFDTQDEYAAACGAKP
jgi:molybdenum cofactor cytidylyltransferase